MQYIYPIATESKRRCEVPLEWAKWCDGVWRSLLTQAYLVCLPTSRTLWTRVTEALPAHATPEEQEALSDLCLLSTVLHPLALQYPRDVATEVTTLQWLHDAFSGRGWTCCRIELCIAACQALIQDQSYEEQELVYKSYVLDAGTLQEYEKREWLKALGAMRRVRESSPEIMLRSGLNGEPVPSSQEMKGTLFRNNVHAEEIMPLSVGQNLKKERSRSNSQNGRKNTREFFAEIKREILSASAAAAIETSGQSIPSEQENWRSYIEVRDDTDTLEHGITEDDTLDPMTEFPLGGLGMGVPCHVTLLEAGRGITRGTTGLTSWGGGAVMAEWIENNTQVVRGKRVLELGAGVGYMASAIITRCRARSQPLKAQQNSTTSRKKLEGSTKKNLTPKQEVSKNRCEEGTEEKVTPEQTMLAHKFERNADQNLIPGWISSTSKCEESTEENVTPEQTMFTHKFERNTDRNLTPEWITSTSKCEGSTEDEAVISYTATDCHPHVLDLLHHNLGLTDTEKPHSYSRLSAHRRRQCQLLAKDELPPGVVSAQPWSSPQDYHVGGVEVKVLQLDWRSADLDSVPDCDVILAADVVYARHLLPYLSRLLRLLLSRPFCDGPQRLPKPCLPTPSDRSVYIACTRRDPETISEFLAALKAENLNHSIVYQATLDAESALFVYNESHIPVKIYKITLDGKKP